MEEKKISEPTEEQERELNDIIENGASEVGIPGTRRKFKVRWLKAETTRKITSILQKDADDRKLSCKVAAAIVLNDYWKIHAFYWAAWRWFYYVRQYTEAQLLPVVMEGKKKVPQTAYYSLIMLAIGMRDTIMTMKKEEVQRFLREHRGERPSA